MIRQETRFDVKLIAPQVLAGFMTIKGHTIRSLAMRAGVSRSVVGFLHSGKRDSCSPATAVAIAKALGCSVENLFVPRVSTVSREVAPPKQTRRAA